MPVDIMDGTRETTITLPEPIEAWAREDISGGGRGKVPEYAINHVLLLACRTSGEEGYAAEAEGQWWLAVAHPDDADYAFLNWYRSTDVHFSRAEAERAIRRFNTFRERIKEEG